MTTFRKKSNRSLLLGIANLLWCLFWAGHSLIVGHTVYATLNALLVIVNIWLIYQNRKNLKWSEDLDRKWDEIMSEPVLEPEHEELPRSHQL